ncbi:hypothetical protein [Demequina aurantiaca]|uniref:hypothetical protein n=1 Tax=Demequina aurantiaca TaxID=676200 RepID=UPI0007825120|nr:hypothetical protein [Demequina aurantiaca]
MPLTAASRLARALTGAALSTLVALGSHVLAGGAMPSAPGIAVPLLLSTAVCFQLAGRELSLWRLGIAVVASQWIFHQLFVLGAPGVGLSSHGGIHAGHDVGSISVTGGGQLHAHGGSGMTVSHLAAAAITVAALFKAEQLLAALATGAARVRSSVGSRTWAGLLARLLAPSVLLNSPSPAATVNDQDACPPELDAASSPVSRRGPPVLHG